MTRLIADIYCNYCDATHASEIGGPDSRQVDGAGRFWIMASQIDRPMAATQTTSVSGSSCDTQEEANAQGLELLDRILNDPNEPLDAGKVWSILDRLTNGPLNEPDETAP